MSKEAQHTFAGDTYSPAKDDRRLTAQLGRIFDLMRDGKRRTLEQIAAATGDPPASISAQLRHLRKERFGAHTVNKYHLGDGLYEYELIAIGEATLLPSPGLRDVTQAKLKSFVLLSFGGVFLRAVLPHIEASDQTRLQQAVRDHLLSNNRRAEAFDYKAKIQEITDCDE